MTSLGGNEYVIMLLSSVKMGSLSNNDGDGYENVTYKVNSRCLKLYRPFSISCNSSNAVKSFLELNSEGLY